MLRLSDIRAQLPVTETTAYLNTGTAGPLPLFAVETIEEALRRELRLGRASPSGLADYPPLVRDTRQRLATLIGADVAEVALTDSTTHGINVVVWGFLRVRVRPWRAEDEVVTSSLEHPGILVPLHQLARRSGVKLRIVRPQAVAAAITDRTRLVAVSHVSFSTGERLPLTEIVQAAHASGVPVLVDGAQAVGAMPVDMQTLGVDFYAFSGQKWLCGPDGTGGLYVRAGQALEPTHVSTHSLRPSGSGGRDPNNVTLADVATRFESTSFFRPALYGLNATLRWLTEEVSLQTVYARTSELASYCHEQVSALDDVEMLTPREAMAGLVNFRVANPAEWVRRLEAHGVTVRSIPETDSLRVSCAFFNTQAEIDRLVHLLREGA